MNVPRVLVKKLNEVTFYKNGVIIKLIKVICIVEMNFPFMKSTPLIQIS
jgi:hypothetical protein